MFINYKKVKLLVLMLLGWEGQGQCLNYRMCAVGIQRERDLLKELNTAVELRTFKLSM